MITALWALGFVWAGTVLYGVWLTRKVHAMVDTGNGRTIGAQINALHREFAEIADAKLLADARLASAALVAVSRLAKTAKEDADLLVEARRTAAGLLDTAGRVATDMADAREEDGGSPQSSPD